MRVSFLISCFFLLLVGCSQKQTENSSAPGEPLYRLIPPAESGIDFVNTITESADFNVVLYDNIMTGAGVGLLDVDNDGLLDIFCAGNMVSDRLYLNKGKFRFEDITQQAGIAEKQNWTSGVTVADVNGDGWDDLYLCKHVLDDPAKRINVYYENQKDGTFRERAGELGIADPGYSVIANFFDYDVDGDLDLYVGNQPPSSLFERPKLKGLRDFRFTDRLYRNDGTRFQEVTVEAGINNYNYTLSVNTSDFNGDMLPDIYVASDYEEPDIMYINQGNGTFKDIIHESIRHMCNFGMGTDIADINNDGYLDIFTADMVAEDHYRNKTNMSGMNPQKFWNLANYGYHYQYMFNALQLNNGNGTYSEIAQLAGVSHTDWSWAAFFLDADQDGWKDLFVGNGQMKDVRNKDYSNKRMKLLEAHDSTQNIHSLFLEISQMAPTQKLQNYFFRNNRNLTFDNQAAAWGFEQETWTQGATYGDLDNDGDMEVVLSNTNDPLMLYESKVNDKRLNNYLVVKVEGPGKNTRGINAKVTIHTGDQKQVAEITPIRGYMSSVQPVAHFGLGKVKTVDRIEVEWPDGSVWSSENVKANQTLTVKHSEAGKKTQTPSNVVAMFMQDSLSDPILYEESVYDDYSKEILLPYKLSALGPVTAKGDVNGDALDDFYVGGGAGFSGKLYVQTSDGMFQMRSEPAFSKDAGYEDGCATFFDADGDKDQDLYVCSGSNEFAAGSKMYQDRLYVNNGKGEFTRSAALPEITASTSVALPMDFDGDSDVDIFVGARQIPGQYGRIPRSLVLRNDNGTYTDVGRQVLPEEGLLGMVTDAAWVQAPAAQPQLVVAGEWMPIRLLQFMENTRFEDQGVPGLEDSEGMWNRVIPADIDGDGDLDLVAGNCGLNMKYSASAEKPFRMVVNDFDGNGTNDVYLGYYDKQNGQCYPVRGRECSSQQMPFVKAKFASYSDFAHATMDQVLEGRMEGSQELKAKKFASGIFENTGGAFTFRPFANLAQVAPVYGIVITDINKDGKKDLVLAGNFYQREVETTRSDAGIGNILLARDGLEYEYVHPSKTGMKAYHDVRNVLLLQQKTGEVLMVANNDAPFQFYRASSSEVQ